MTSAYSAVYRAETSDPQKILPSEVGVWLFILGDLLVFGLLFGLYAYERAHSKQLFLESQATLSLHFGAINTLVLLCSSYFVALALHAARQSKKEKLTRFLALAFSSGAVFLCLKIFEWSAKFAAGITLASNDFFSYYFVLTGLHLIHVLIGMGLIGELWRRSLQGLTGRNALRDLESGAIYWHMVDLLWVVLFPLVYLMN